MRLFEMFEGKIDEVNMSPGALADFANSELAQSMTAGFETELIVPNILDEEEAATAAAKARKYPNNERTKSLEQIEKFFLQNERNTPKKVQNVIKTLTNMIENNYRKVNAEAYLANYLPTMLDIKQRIGSLKWPFDYDPDAKPNNKDLYTELQISELISKAIGMPVKYASGYHGEKRGSGYFILEPDSSIAYDEDDNEAGLELVSPPMPLAQCLEYLDKVFAWANSFGCKTDQSTGFHMGISIPNQNKNNVDYVKFVLFLGDEYVLNEFGRGDNEYAQALSSILVGNLSYDFKRTLAKVRAGMNSKAARTLTKNLGSSHNGKYVSVNIKPNYIEVRSAGGVDYIKNVDKIKLTLMRYVRAMAIAADPEAEKNEYAKKFYKFLNRSSHFPREENAIMPLFVQYSTGQMSAEELTQEILTIRQHKVANTFNSLKKVPTPQTGQGTEYFVLDDEGKLLHKLSAYSRKDAEKLAIKWARSENYPVSVYDMRVVLPNSKIGQAALTKAADQKQNIKHVKAYRVSFMLDGENFRKTVQIASEDEVYDWFAKNMPDAEIEHLQPIYHQ